MQSPAGIPDEDGPAITLATPPGDGPLLVGYSGGLDSTVLLHLVAADPGLRARGLRAIHVHHGLHPDADGWALHSRRECDALGIPLDVVRVEVPRGRGDGLEAAAREARHAAFARVLPDDGILALAHHLDDQAETFLLRALRASGDGLGAMAPWRRFGRGFLWRPLLGVPRERLLAWARARGLRWIEDPANAELAHDRNFLRHQVMPLLHERWPHAAVSLARSAGLQREASALLDDGDTMALAMVRGVDPACLDAGKLAALPAMRRARVLRRWIAGRGLPPLPAGGVARIERDLLGEAGGHAPEYAWADAVVRRWRGLLWAGYRQPPLPPGFHAIWDGQAPLELPTGDRLAFMPQPAQAGGPWTVHARRGGERIVLPGRRHSHALKHVLQDLGVPPWVRARMPLLSFADGSLAAAGDLVFSAAFDAWLRTAGCRLSWTPAP